MKSLNYIFTDINELEEFIDNNNIKNSNNILVQIFSGVVDEILCKSLATTIKEILPQAYLIGVTTAGEIAEGKMIEKKVVISFSIFKTTKIKSKLYLNKSEEKCAEQIVDDLVADNTKVIIVFSDGLRSNGEEILKQITLLRPGLIIAGGRAGDYHKFQKTFVFDENSATENGFVVASLSGDDLIVNNNYMLNWDTIGEDMIVTKANKNHLFTINDQPAVEIYKKYLGENISSSLPDSGVEFPLILQRGKVNVARAPIAVFEDDSLLFGGNIYEGEKVKFGFGNLDMVRNKSFSDYNYFKSLPVEATYIYSCSARKTLLGKDLETEFNFLQNLAPTIGFFTYGEFFHSQDINELLNITTTFLSLSETTFVPRREEFSSFKESNSNRTLKALSHLVSVTSSELLKTNDSLKIKIQENEKIKQSLSEGQRIAKFGIWEWNLVDNDVWMSDGQMRLFGMTPETYTHSFKEYIHPDDIDMVNANIEKAFKKEKAYSITHRIIKANNGEVIYLHVEGEVEFDKDGKPVFMKGTAQDVTELVKSQNELEAYKNSLERQVEEQIQKRREQEIMLMQQSRLASMGEMIGNIAHQWRQPLNALNLVIGNIKDAYDFGKLDDVRLNKAVEKSNMLIQKMSSTIDDFRDFFKPDKEKTNFSVSSAVDDSLQLVEALLSNANITVEKHLVDTAFIDGFHNEFSQVILNIVNNSKDALIENRADERLIRIDLTSKDGNVLLSISDNAGGIPENIINRIFEPYFTTKGQSHGTGIGLYMSKMIIEDHMSGELSVKNIKNDKGEVTGAMFIIKI